MAKGGFRPGAGRKKGGKNQATREAMAEAAKGGVLPRDYMLGVMRDETQPVERRDRMAAAVAPYVHPKLQTTTLTGADGGPINVTVTKKELDGV